MNFTVECAVTPTANPTTIIQVLAPTNRKLVIPFVEISLRGSTPATAPVPFDWVTQTDTGTGSSKVTPIKQDRGSDEDIANLYEFRTGFASEPTMGSRFINFALHQQGTMPCLPPFPIIVKTAERVGLRYRSSTYVECVVTLYVEG